MSKIEEKKIKKKSPFFMFATCFLVAGILFSQAISVGCSAYQNEINEELKQQKQVLAEEKNNGAKLEIEIDKRADKFAIEEYAVKNLHMQKVKNYQIQYIQSEQASYAELLTPEEDSILETMVKPLSVIWNFFGE